MSPRGLALFPGAGSSSTHSALLAIEAHLPDVTVGRFDFPYRKVGKKFPDKADVDRNYVEAMQRLMEQGRYPGLATHDEVIIAEAKRFAKARGIAADRFEFHMLYGVRRDLQEQIVKEGYRMRVYVPFGSQWYPYLMRRLAERPANIAFMAGNIVKESLSR